jgi:hypothetical protein
MLCNSRKKAAAKNNNCGLLLSCRRADNNGEDNNKELKNKKGVGEMIFSEKSKDINVLRNDKLFESQKQPSKHWLLQSPMSARTGGLLK